MTRDEQYKQANEEIKELRDAMYVALYEGEFDIAHKLGKEVRQLEHSAMASICSEIRQNGARFAAGRR